MVRLLRVAMSTVMEWDGRNLDAAVEAEHLTTWHSDCDMGGFRLARLALPRAPPSRGRLEPFSPQVQTFSHFTA